jgi:hypothetical protein
MNPPQLLLYLNLQGYTYTPMLGVDKYQKVHLLRKELNTPLLLLEVIPDTPHYPATSLRTVSTFSTYKLLTPEGTLIYTLHYTKDTIESLVETGTIKLL